MDRYRVELSLNVWSDTDKGAVKIAQDICDEQKQKFDNRCEIIKVCSSPFGRIEGEDIKLSEMSDEQPNVKVLWLE